MSILRNIILGFLIIFFLISLTKNFFEYRRNIEFYHAYESEYQEAKEKNNKLKAQLVKSSDFYYMEKNIREKLNLLKANEVAIMIPEVSPTPTILTPTPPPNYQQWADVFFKN